VIGVVGDVRYDDLATPPAAIVYVPQAMRLDSLLEPSPRRTLALVVRTSGSTGSIAAGVRRIVHELDPNVPIFGVKSMSEVVRASTARLSFALALTSAAAVISLLLSVIGLYGVMAYMVALRTREFGVRVALGADPKRVAASVALQGSKLVASGVLGGLVLFLVVGQFLRGFVYEISPTDPVALAITVIVLAGAASVAMWVPARRAALVDPAEALRSQ
jgi:ABC-type antimicrobial peptide transport system permease subunit